MTWFINGWIALIFALNIASIIGFMLVAPTVWAGIEKIQDVYGPFNMVNWVLELASLSPAFGIMIWRDKRRAAKKF